MPSPTPVACSMAGSKFITRSATSAECIGERMLFTTNWIRNTCPLLAIVRSSSGWRYATAGGGGVNVAVGVRVAVQVGVAVCVKVEVGIGSVPVMVGVRVSVTVGVGVGGTG